MQKEIIISTNAYKLIGDRCRLSERTVRTAFSRKPITFQTALALARVLDFDTVNCFVIKTDNRGRNKKAAPKKRSGKKITDSAKQ